MKLILLKNNLLAGLGIVERAITDNPNQPILKNVLIDAKDNKIYLTSTNLELAIKHLVPGKIIETGSTTVPLGLFNNIIKNLNSERVSLEEKNKQFFVNTDNYEATIQGLGSKDFPIIPSIQNKKNFLQIKSNQFLEVLSKAIVAAQYSDIRPEISGVLMKYKNNELVLVATDSFRLTEIKTKNLGEQSLPEETSVVVPLRTASELLRILTDSEEMLEIFIDSNQILFQTNNTSIISRLIDGVFPDYESILPKQTKNEIVINRAEFVNGVKLARVFSGRANDITLSVGESKKFIEIYSADSSIGKNSYKIPIKLKGEKLSVTFNWKYLLDGLSIYKNEEIFLGLNASDKPAIIKNPSEPQALYVLMPIKS
ncbi:MAG: DNA polymerase III subunit beta [Patescibacteria group bacterium]